MANTMIKDFATERTSADAGDYFIAQDPITGTTYKIKKQNLIAASSNNNSQLLQSKSVLIANYQTDFNDLKAHPCTVVGSPSISADKSPFPGGSSLYLPGNSYLNYQPNSDFNLSADYIIEFYVWLSSVYANNNTYAGIVNIQNENVTITVGLYRSGYNNNGITKQLYFQTYSSSQGFDASCYSLTSFSFDTWNHVSAIKLGNVMYFSINEKFQLPAILSTLPRFLSSPSTISVGLFPGVPPIINSYIAGLRIKSSFVKAPTLPFTD
ncbi:hypothetical protein [Nostoc sp. ChiVER01]|uniref:hypothetical protein n=1 Tax=Nostoc sp. ChiVER01 TaxID=3075382 RepID=UPI002AD2EB86|nr:hypothetical protein [Nostoc sp. ChiVER01]MDZ8227528.1 hypothetical protein [Nostoc sp. ChiVER01]